MSLHNDPTSATTTTPPTTTDTRMSAPQSQIPQQSINEENARLLPSPTPSLTSSPQKKRYLNRHGATDSDISGRYTETFVPASTSADLLSFHWAAPTWMGDLSEVLSRRRLCYVRMMGSHDSATYGIGPTSDFGVDAPGLLRSTSTSCFTSLLKRCAKPITRGWAKTQALTVYQQLLHGVRYLDLRAAWSGTEYYITHSLLSVPFKVVVQDIYKFYHGDDMPPTAAPIAEEDKLQSPPPVTTSKEILIMDIQHLFGFSLDSAEECRRFYNELQPIWHLCMPPPYGPASTLGDIWATPYRILLCIGNELAYLPQWAHRRETVLRSPWHNRNTAQRLIDRLLGAFSLDANHHHSSTRQENNNNAYTVISATSSTASTCPDNETPPPPLRQLYVTQAVMTPVTKDIVRGIISCFRKTPTTIRDYACHINDSALRWFRDINLRPDIRHMLLAKACQEGFECFHEDDDEEEDERGGTRSTTSRRVLTFNTHSNVLMLDYIEEGLCEWDLETVHGSPVSPTFPQQQSSHGANDFPSSSVPAGYYYDDRYNIKHNSSDKEPFQNNSKNNKSSPQQSHSATSSLTGSFWTKRQTSSTYSAADGEENNGRMWSPNTISLNGVQLCVYINLTIGKLVAANSSERKRKPL